MTTPEVTVNGRLRPIGAIEPFTTALDWLREQGLTGSKEGCAEGECGACAIMVARPSTAASTVPSTGGRAETPATEWVAINSCLVAVAGLDGQEVLTAEGLGTPTALHPVQHEMAVRGGSQCGYCTPGFICSMAAEYYRPGRCDRSEPQPTNADDGPAHDLDPNGPGAEADAEHGPNGFDLHALSGNLCR
jgi:xanthine dehydrogenase small subunit